MVVYLAQYTYIYMKYTYLVSGHLVATASVCTLDKNPRYKLVVLVPVNNTLCGQVVMECVTRYVV